MGDSIPSVVRFMQDTIIAAGNSPYLMHWGLSGKLKYKVGNVRVIYSCTFLSLNLGTPCSYADYAMKLVCNYVKQYPSRFR